MFEVVADSLSALEEIIKVDLYSKLDHVKPFYRPSISARTLNERGLGLASFHEVEVEFRDDW